MALLPKPPLYVLLIRQSMSILTAPLHLFFSGDLSTKFVHFKFLVKIDVAKSNEDGAPLFGGAKFVNSAH